MKLLIVLVLAYFGFKFYGRYKRRQDLIARYGRDTADRILRKEIWQGATRAMLLESRGEPAEIKEHVLKAKTKHTYCYGQIAKNRYAVRVHLEDGVVVGWDV